MKNEDLIKIKFSKQENVISEMESFFKNSHGFRIASIIQQQKKNRIKELLGRMHNVFFALEYPYIDKHHLDCYSTYFSTKFENFHKDCIRVHVFENNTNVDINRIEMIFEKNINIDANDFEKSVEQILTNNYLGFFILRPLTKRSLGRSVISPKAFKQNDFYCCLMRQKVSLCGIELNVSGFPHVAQDGEMHSCAESAIWSLLNYYSKHEDYRYISPSEVVASISEVTNHRSFPSIGLNLGEMALCLKSKGFHCTVYDKDRNTKITLKEIINLYIESGIPVIIGLYSERSGHAVLAIGHADEEVTIPQSEVWADVCSFDRNLVFIDDNQSPYQLAKFDSPTKYYEDNEIFKDMKIQTLIVPLPKYVYLEADSAMLFIKDLFETPKTSLKLTNKKWLTRLLLTNSRSYKSWIIEKGKITDVGLKRLLMHIKFPEFIWICEMYTDDGYENEEASGLLILDATGSASLSSVLLYCLEYKLYTLSDDRMSWKSERKLKNLFTIKTYKHNLRGEWSSWQ